MEKKYSMSKKNYNFDKTFLQISKDVHKKMKDYCILHDIKMKDFLEKLIINNI